jgi:hypothetical protein
MPFDFQSPGAAASAALRAFLLQREQQRRQDFLDSLTADKQASDAAFRNDDLKLRQQQESRTAAAQQQQIADAEAERQFRRASTIAENALPDDPTDESTADLLRSQGYGGQLNAIPGVVGADGKTGTATYKLRGGSKYLNARAAEDARRQQAADTNASRQQIADMNAQQRAEAAAARMQQAQTSNELAAARLDLQKAMADMKIDGAKQDRDDKAHAVAVGRSEIRELAQSLLDDPALESITGPVEGRRDTFFRSANVDALRRLQQLQNKLSLESRSKLKGQGQVSDYEGKMLASAVSAIDRSAGPEAVRKHLNEIVNAFSGDSPYEQPTTAGAGGGGVVTLRDPNTGATRQVSRSDPKYRAYLAAGAVEVR